ncbi:TetR/AcrR family transcriptional regulator [Litoreibacter albidus]|uniref:Transcriptional regulator, TetR family n=1 Tax=Litoreibacter albidus TaxID=670155 RepID=A0A1H3CKN4_9RHOB|nr:TetR/AcrR family transcriptional regulator [Litoreibacter albidus]SDX54580.1 transcriptional regulator, TetR family [Litoreibacter albidus]
MAEKKLVRIRNAERTIRVLKKATKDQLIKRGFNGLSIQSIQDDAGVSKGAMFHHFPSKDHLVAAAFEDVLVEFTQAMQETGRALQNGHITKTKFVADITAIMSSDLVIGCLEISLAMRNGYSLADLIAPAIETWRAALADFWIDTFDLPNLSAQDARTHWALASNAMRGHALATSFGTTKKATQLHCEGFERTFLSDAQVRPLAPKITTLK